MVGMSISLLTDKLLKVQQVAHSLFQTQSAAVNQVMPFWARSGLCLQIWKMLPFLPCDSEEHADYLSFSCSLISHSSPFFYSCVNILEIVSVAIDIGSHTVSSSIWNYHYGCYTQPFCILLWGFCIIFITLQNLVRLSICSSYTFIGITDGCTNVV